MDIMLALLGVWTTYIPNSRTSEAKPIHESLLALHQNYAALPKLSFEVYIQLT